MTGPFHYSSIVFCDQTNLSSSVSFYPLVFVSGVIINNFCKSGWYVA